MDIETIQPVLRMAVLILSACSIAILAPSIWQAARGNISPQVGMALGALLIIVGQFGITAVYIFLGHDDPAHIYKCLALVAMAAGNLAFIAAHLLGLAELRIGRDK